ncbi:MAG: hypothetical protein EOP84_37075 [Verrucomicrobiaceae bacterium]|nr:MAG: hypothetical protein EOP84_37075 [Verrucomicrobiaceae bacterium]
MRSLTGNHSMKSDRIVAILTGIWFLYGFVALSFVIVGTGTTYRPFSLTSATPFILFALLVIMAWANACIGVYLSRPWGFRWMIFLAGLMLVGMTASLIARQMRLGIGDLIPFLTYLALLFYSINRLRSLRLMGQGH